MGLFWIRPNFFPVLNIPVSNYIEKKWNILVDQGIDGDKYLEIRKELLQKTSRSFPEISHAAYLENTGH